MALGARSAAVVSLVVRQSAIQIVIGVAAGIGGAALLSRYLEGLLFGVTPLDTLTYAAASRLRSWRWRRRMVPRAVRRRSIR